MNDYQEQILDHFKNPRHYGKPSFTPTHTKKLLNPTCGDEIEVFLDIENNNIKNISFIGRGCSISMASASLLTEIFDNQTIDQINNYSASNLLEMLGINLTTSRKNCALLSLDAFKKAIKI